MKEKSLFRLISITVFAIYILTGCGIGQQNESVVIEKNHKKITVLTKDEEVVTNELALKKIDRYDGVNGTDWLSEDNILIEQKNIELPKTAMTYDGKYDYHMNLFSYDIHSKKSHAILGEEIGQIGPIVSPDKKYIFYKKSIDGTTGTGYIMDLSNKKSIKVSDIDKIFAFSTEGRWINNNEIIYPTIDHKMFKADVHGNIVKIDPNSDIVYSLKNKFGGIKVEWVLSSPNHKQFVIVRKISQTKRELFITDSLGRKSITLAKGTQIFGSSWSPNSKMVAYSVISENKGERGLFVIDVNSRKITQLSTDLDELSGPISWSPSGKKILVTKVLVTNNKNNFVTYVLSLKK